MKQKDIDCWYINGTDPHQSEYVCPRWRSRAWISGFSGSAGTVVVTAKDALLWVDSRYFIQGAQQIEGTCFKLMKLDTENTPSPLDWIRTHLKKGQSVGIDHGTSHIRTRQICVICVIDRYCNTQIYGTGKCNENELRQFASIDFTLENATFHVACQPDPSRIASGTEVFQGVPSTD